MGMRAPSALSCGEVRAEFCLKGAQERKQQCCGPALPAWDTNARLTFLLGSPGGSQSLMQCSRGCCTLRAAPQRGAAAFPTANAPDSHKDVPCTPRKGP